MRTHQIFADILAAGGLVVERGEIHLQHVWMIDTEGDSSALMDGEDNESDEGEASETDDECAPRSVVSHHDRRALRLSKGNSLEDM
ncbi:hypothetical protein CYMTET_26132 [Cymbomonas tetramitiformis]|uniref:Uncharacterized protein n=1 Tax=Cymbomonas tetramitiformis TaxID=36881 RepID=A0AAE0KY91_9CHLO|nr:hypothetical protein CYMTET_26132 [Cymbomonas tetramitiformis]